MKIIYIYKERERERERGLDQCSTQFTPAAIGRCRYWRGTTQGQSIQRGKEKREKREKEGERERERERKRLKMNIQKDGET